MKKKKRFQYRKRKKKKKKIGRNERRKQTRHAVIHAATISRAHRRRKLVLAIALDDVRTRIRKRQLKGIALGVAGCAREVDGEQHVRTVRPRDRLGAADGDGELRGVLHVPLVQLEGFAFCRAAGGARGLAAVAGAGGGPGLVGAGAGAAVEGVLR